MSDSQINEQTALKQEIEELRASNYELRSCLRTVAKTLTRLTMLSALGAAIQWIILNLNGDYASLDSHSKSILNWTTAGILFVILVVYLAFSSSIPEKPRK